MTPWRSISLHVSLKTGLVIGLGDDMMHYKVATTDVKISREEAIRIAMPYIQAYALKHLLTIKKIEATFSFENDVSLDRRKDRNGLYMVYPRWMVIAWFTTKPKSGVCGYDVLLWADNGKVYHHCPQGFYSGGAAGPSWPLPAAAFTAILTLAIYRRLKTHKGTQRIGRKNMEGSGGGGKAMKTVKGCIDALSWSLMVTLLLFSSIPQMAHADSSTILGSRHDITEEEICYDNRITNLMMIYSQKAGYTTYNWCGEPATKENSSSRCWSFLLYPHPL